jgi:hypothetical protein
VGQIRAIADALLVTDAAARRLVLLRASTDSLTLGDLAILGRAGTGTPPVIILALSFTDNAARGRARAAAPTSGRAIKGPPPDIEKVR